MNTKEVAKNIVRLADRVDFLESHVEVGARSRFRNVAEMGYELAAILIRRDEELTTVEGLVVDKFADMVKELL